MLIVLDTNQFWSDIWMEKTDFKILQEYVNRHAPQAHLIVPKIVVEEVVNNYRARVVEAIGQVRNAASTLKSYVYDLDDIAARLPADVDALMERYAKDFQLILDRFSAEQPGYDHVNINSLVQRALARRQPFDKHGQNGFRDSLIWESVLPSIDKHKQRVVLITKNTRDFGEHGGLADGLKDDLKEHKLEHLSVTVCQELKRFIAEEIKPHLDKLDAIADQIQAGTYEPFNALHTFGTLFPSIEKDVRRIVPTMELETTHNRVRYRNHQLKELAATPERFTVANVWRLETNEHLVINIYYYVPATLVCQTDYIGSDIQSVESMFKGRVTLLLPMEFVLNTLDGDVSWDLDERIDTHYNMDDWWKLTAKEKT